jgi:tyrosyl-DNA phosphodiesterase 1
VLGNLNTFVAFLTKIPIYPSPLVQKPPNKRNPQFNMGGPEPGGDPPTKRRKLNDDTTTTNNEVQGTKSPSGVRSAVAQAWIAKGLDRPISPPLSRRVKSRTTEPATSRDEQHQQTRVQQTHSTLDLRVTGTQNSSFEFITSPVSLTRIKDLSPAQNVDTIGLGEILGDPMIKECWNFNYLFDLDFVM